MVQQRFWLVVPLLCLVSITAVAADRHGVTATPAAASPAPSATATAPAVTPIEPPPAGAKADQIADYAAELFKQQRYSEAGDALKLAYEREGRPIFLFNVGQTYRKCGRYADAIAAYKRFVEVAPEHPLASEARGYQNTLVVLVEQQQRANQIEMSLMDKQAETDKVRQNLALEQRKTEEAQRELAAEKARKNPVYKRPWFVGLMTGVGGVVLIVGASFLITQVSYLTTGGTLSFMPAK